MSPEFGFDPEEQHRQEAAELLMLRVGLALLDDARRAGGFETDPAKMGARIAELADELDDHPSARPGDAQRIQATPLAPDRVSLSVAHSESSSVEATLRSDGVLLDQASAFGIAVEAVDEEKLSPEELEEMQRAMAEFEAERARPQFTGKSFLRALPVEPQPDFEVQVLAVELFDDGLLIHHTFDREAESANPLATGTPFDWPDPAASIQVEDDLGTEYHASASGTGGGVRVVHGASGFAPAVPADAGVLRIEMGDRTIELSL